MYIYRERSTGPQAANLNGQHLASQLCKDGGLLALNNLQYRDRFCFSRSLTFRQRDRWISAFRHII